MTHQLTEAAIVRPSRDMETNPIPLSMRSKVWTSWAVLYHLPEGDLKIARQFTAGFKFDIPNVPKGRMNRAKPTGLLLIPSLWQNFSRPFGTCCPYSSNPPLKGWAIFKSPSGRWQANPLRWLRARTPAPCSSWRRRSRTSTCSRKAGPRRTAVSWRWSSRWTTKASGTAP